MVVAVKVLTRPVKSFVRVPGKGILMKEDVEIRRNALGVRGPAMVIEDLRWARRPLIRLLRYRGITPIFVSFDLNEQVHHTAQVGLSFLCDIAD